MRYAPDLGYRKRNYGLHVVEDAAHAAGTLYEGTHVRSLQSESAAVPYSFYATKNMTTGKAA